MLSCCFTARRLGESGPNARPTALFTLFHYVSLFSSVNPKRTSPLKSHGLGDIICVVHDTPPLGHHLCSSWFTLPVPTNDVSDGALGDLEG